CLTTTPHTDHSRQVLRWLHTLPLHWINGTFQSNHLTVFVVDRHQGFTEIAFLAHLGSQTTYRMSISNSTSGLGNSEPSDGIYTTSGMANVLHNALVEHRSTGQGGVVVAIATTTTIRGRALVVGNPDEATLTKRSEV